MKDEQQANQQLSPNNSAQMSLSSGVASDNSEDEEDLKMPAVASIGCQSPSTTSSSSGYPTATTTTTTTTSTNSSEVDTTKKSPSKSSLASSSTSTHTNQKKPTTSTKRARKPHHHPSFQQENRILRPAPYFYYKNHSHEIDDDPLSPLSPALSVPNFVVKLHAMLICDQFRGVVDWMGHGRSFKIWNQARFEKEVLPIYFRQGSIASFYRQANGWGFRRILKGQLLCTKGSFYHERFIRGLPHLCKKMKRVGVAKLSADTNINHEPILYKIAADHPTPTELPKESLDWIVLNEINRSCFENGPSAKMPFFHNIDELTARAHAKEAQASLEQNNKKPEASPGLASSLAPVLLGVETGTTAFPASSLLVNSQTTQLNEQQNQQLLLNQYQQITRQQTQQRLTQRTTPSSSLEEKIQVQQLLSQTSPQEASHLLQVLQEIRNHRLSSTFGQQQNSQVQHQERQLTSLPQANGNVTLSRLGTPYPQDSMAAFLIQYQAQQQQQQQQQQSATTHAAATASSASTNLLSSSQQPGSQDSLAAFLQQHQAQQQQQSATTHAAATASSASTNLLSSSQQPSSQDSLAAFLRQYQARQQQQPVTTHAAATRGLANSSHYPSLAANLLSSRRPADAQGAANHTSLVDLLSSASRQQQSTLSSSLSMPTSSVGIGNRMLTPADQLAGLQQHLGSNNSMNLLTRSNNDSDILRQLIRQQTNTATQEQQQTLLQNSTQSQASSLQQLLARQQQQTTALALQQQTSPSSIGGTPPLPSSLTSLSGLQQQDQLIQLLLQEQQKRLREQSQQQSGQMGNQKNNNP